MSASVYEQVRDKLALPFRDLRARAALKNIDRPIRIYRWTFRRHLVRGRSTAGVERTCRCAVAGCWRGRGGPWPRLRVAAGGDHRLLRSAASCRPSKTASSTSDRRLKPESGLSVAVLRIHQPERRCRPGLFLRRPHRGHHPRARPLQGSSRCSPMARCCPTNKEVPPAEIGRALNARYLVSGSVRRCRRARPGHRAAERRRQRHPALGRAIRRRADAISSPSRSASPAGRRHAGLQPADRSPCSTSLRKPTDNLDAYDLLLRARALAADPTRAGQPHGARDARAGDPAGAGLTPTPTPSSPTAISSAPHYGWSEFAQDRHRDGDPARPKGHRARRGMRAAPTASWRAPTRRPDQLRYRPSPNRSGRCRSIRATPRSC